MSKTREVWRSATGWRVLRRRESGGVLYQLVDPQGHTEQDFAATSDDAAALAGELFALGWQGGRRAGEAAGAERVRGDLRRAIGCDGCGGAR